MPINQLRQPKPGAKSGGWQTRPGGISAAKDTRLKNNFLIFLALCALMLGLTSADGRNLVLTWNASTDPGIAGYNLYYGTSSGNYTNKVAAGNATTVTVSNLNAGVTYYFSATAYDANANESGFSAEATFIVPGQLTLSQGATAGSPPVVRFPVEPGHWYEVQATTDLQSWNTIWQTASATTNDWVQFTDSNAGAFNSRFYRLVLH